MFVDPNCAVFKKEYWRSIVDRRAPGRVAACCEPSALKSARGSPPLWGSRAAPNWPRPSPARPTIDSASGGGVELVEAGPRAARPSVAEAVYAGVRAHARPGSRSRAPAGDAPAGVAAQGPARLAACRLASWALPLRFPSRPRDARARAFLAAAPGAAPREEPHTPQATTKHIALPPVSFN